MEKHNVKRIFLISLAIIAAIFVYWWRFNLAQNKIKIASVDSRLGEKAEVIGMIDNDPEEGVKNIKFVLKSEDHKRYLVTADLGQVFHYGQVLKVRGNLSAPENFITDNGRIFDYVHYLAKDKIHYLIKYATVEVVGERGNQVKKILFKIKNSFKDSIQAFSSKFSSSGCFPPSNFMKLKL